MNPPLRIFLASLAITVALGGSAHAEDDLLDQFSDHLVFSSPHSQVSARISGLVDVEGYYIPKPAPGLLYTDKNVLVTPRLTVFLDAQLGPNLYFFAQARLDQGFDPSDEGVQVRLDEYALRWTPGVDGHFCIQIGKFATVAGNWANRHSSWDNPFITAPLPYENLTSIWDSAAADSAETLLDWGYSSTPELRNPIIWGPSYTSGLAVSGRIGQFEYAAEIKNASLSSRPEAWDVTSVGFEHPTYTARLGWRPNEAWNLGISGSTGSYLLPDAGWSVAPGHSLDDYRETVLSQDLSYAWHHWQVWAEVFETRFAIPDVGNADTLAYYVEAKYKFNPQLFGALRWNQQLYNSFRENPDAPLETWTADVWRIDAALTWRWTPHIQSKLQYSLFWEDYAPIGYQNYVAGQFTVRF